MLKFTFDASLVKEFKLRVRKEKGQRRTEWGKILRKGKKKAVFGKKKRGYPL